MIFKHKINFKKLRDEGVNSLEIKDKEIVQVITKAGFLCVIDSEYYSQLLMMEAAVKEHVYGEQPKIVQIDIDKKVEEFKLKWDNMNKPSMIEEKIKNLKESFSKDFDRIEKMMKEE